jgi:hypothetical protein
MKTLSVLLGNHVLDREIKSALPLAFDPVTFSRAHCDRVPRKPLSFTVVVARISLDQPRILQFLGHVEVGGRKRVCVDRLSARKNRTIHIGNTII